MFLETKIFQINLGKRKPAEAELVLRTSMCAAYVALVTEPALGGNDQIVNHPGGKVYYNCEKPKTTQFDCSNLNFEHTSFCFS